jgi:hypothetical protein
MHRNVMLRHGREALLSYYLFGESIFTAGGELKGFGFGLELEIQHRDSSLCKGGMRCLRKVTIQGNHSGSHKRSLQCVLPFGLITSYDTNLLRKLHIDAFFLHQRYYFICLVFSQNQGEYVEWPGRQALMIGTLKKIKLSDAMLACTGEMSNELA